MTDDLNIRRALAAEASTLTGIAHSAKRHWGYPEEWIELWREALTITDGYLLDHEVFLGETGGDIVGFYSLVGSRMRWELDHFWIRPAFMGRGFGRTLFAHAVDRLRSLSPGASLRIESDPNAERFYVRMGAERIGEVSSDSRGLRRTLPLLRLATVPVAPAASAKSSSKQSQSGSGRT